MDKRFEVTVEFGVKGCSNHITTYIENSLEKIKDKMNKDIDQFVKDINAAQEQDGDLRAYCPQNANGYPSAPLGAEMNDDYNVTILTMLEDVVRHVEIPYHNERYTDLRTCTGCG